MSCNNHSNNHKKNHSERVYVFVSTPSEVVVVVVVWCVLIGCEVSCEWCKSMEQEHCHATTIAITIRKIIVRGCMYL